MTTQETPKKLIKLIHEREIVETQIRAHRVVALRKQSVLMNHTIIGVSTKKTESLADFKQSEEQLTKFNKNMAELEKQISLVFYLKEYVDALIDDLEDMGEQISNALVQFAAINA